MNTKFKDREFDKKSIPVDILNKAGINVFIKSNPQKRFVQQKKENLSNISLVNKIIIFDVNPINDQVVNEIVAGKLASSLKNISSKNMLIFTSIMSFEAMYKLIIKDLQLTNGFIISNNGARVYDIFNKQFIFQKNLTVDQKNMVAHNACMFGWYTIASTQSQDLAYFCNYLDAEEFKKLSYHEFSYTTNYTIYNSYFTSNNFLSFLCFEKDQKILENKYQLLKKVQKEWKINISEISNRMFTITAEGVNKLNAIYLIISYLNFSNIEEIYYFAMNNFDPKCWNAFSKNHYINIDLLIHVKSKAKIDESFYLSTLNIALVRLLKTNSEYRNYLMCKNFYSSVSAESTIDPDALKNKPM